MNMSQTYMSYKNSVKWNIQIMWQIFHYVLQKYDFWDFSINTNLKSRKYNLKGNTNIKRRKSAELGRQSQQCLQSWGCCCCTSCCSSQEPSEGPPARRTRHSDLTLRRWYFVIRPYLAVFQLTTYGPPDAMMIDWKTVLTGTAVVSWFLVFILPHAPNISIS